MRTENSEFYLPTIDGLYKFNTLWSYDKIIRLQVSGIVNYSNLGRKVNTK